MSPRLHKKSPRMTRLAAASCSLVANPRGGLLGCTAVIRPECARYKVKAKTLTLHNRCVETHAWVDMLLVSAASPLLVKQSRVVTLLTVSRVMQSVRLGHTGSLAQRGDTRRLPCSACQTDTDPSDTMMEAWTWTEPKGTIDTYYRVKYLSVQRLKNLTEYRTFTCVTDQCLHLSTLFESTSCGTFNSRTILVRHVSRKDDIVKSSHLLSLLPSVFVH